MIDGKVSPSLATGPTETISPASAPATRLGLSTVVAIVLALTLLRLLVAARSGLVFDEGYYTLWSVRLATGYLDHPPAVAVMIAIGRFLAGDNPLGVRLIAVLMGLALSGLIWRTGELLLGRRAALLAVLWYNVAPVAGVDFLTTPDPPSALFWMATVWALAEFVASRQRNWWLVAGVAVGLGLASKYTAAFLAPGLILLLLSSRERRQWLTYWQVWAAGLLTILVFSPVIWWNAQHGWASFLFQGRRTVSGAVGTAFFSNFGDFLGGQALYMTPVFLGFGIAGVAMFLRAPRRPDRAGLTVPVVTALPALAYFCYHTLHAEVDANWLIPLWPPLSLAAAFAALALWERHPRLGQLATALQVAIGLAATAVVYVQTLYYPFPLGASDRTSETRGWAAFDARLEQLAASHGARWIATSRDYAATGEIASYLLFDHSPLPIRQIDERPRWTFLPPFDADAAGWPALFVQTSADAPHPTPPTSFFNDVQKIDSFARDGGNGPLETWSVYLVSQPRPAFYSGLGEPPPKTAQ